MNKTIWNIISMLIWGATLYFSISGWNMSDPLTNGKALWLTAWAVTWLNITKK